MEKTRILEVFILSEEYFLLECEVVSWGKWSIQMYIN